MPVLPPTVMLIQKLGALGQHHSDFAKLSPAVRAIPERLDWDHIRALTRRQRLRGRVFGAG
jgi:hypothetical protein